MNWLKHEYLTVKKIQTELAEHHLARPHSMADAIRRSGLLRFQLVMLT